MQTTATWKTVLRLAAVALCTMAWLVLFPGYASAAGADAFVAKGSGLQSLDRHLEYLDDPDGTFSIEQVASGQVGEFQRLTHEKKLAYDYKPKALWLRVAIDARNYKAPDWHLYYNYEHIGNIQVFYPDGSGFAAQEMDQHLPLEGRQMLTRGYVFTLPTPVESPSFHYVRLEPGTRFLRVNFSWTGTKGLAERLQLGEFAYGLFFGALLIMWFYNATLCLFLRDRNYFYYIYYLGCFIAVFLHIYGFTALFLQLSITHERIFAAAGYGAIHGLVLFTRQFLSLKSTTKWLDRYLLFFQWVLVIGAVAAFFQPVGQPYRFLNVLILLIVPAAVAAGLIRLRQGYSPAKVYSLGWVFLGVALAVLAARSLNLLPENVFTDYATRIAAVWEAALFSIALGYRIKLADAEALTQQKNALLAERKAAEIAEQAATDKSKFLGMISHELKSPLQSIISALDVLEQRRSDLDGSEFVGRIRRGSNALFIQLRDLLTFAQGDAGKLEVVPQAFEASELVHDVVGMYLDKAQKKGIALRIVEPDEPVYLVADPTRIFQVLNNLVNNAVKYTDKGEVTVTLEPFDSMQGTFGLAVRDTGPGIPSRFIPSLFAPYKRFAALDRSRDSTGIGLTIVHMVVEHLGGRIDVQSEERVGSVFSVRIPAVAPPDDDDAQDREPHARHLLIVDDREEVLEGVASVVQNLGFTCDKAASAAVAANLLAARPYDLVLVDFDMPKKNGAELASETRRSTGPNKNAKIIAFSATDHADMGANWPFDGFLEKPVTREALRRVIEARPYSP